MFSVISFFLSTGRGSPCDYTWTWSNMCHGMLWNPPYPRLTLLHQALVTESHRTWQPSPTPLGICGLCSWRPQHRIKCSERRCRLRDVKHVITSCRNDVMIPYKRSRPVRNRVLLATDRQLDHQPSLSNRVLSRNHSGGSHCFLIK